MKPSGKMNKFLMRSHKNFVLIIQCYVKLLSQDMLNHEDNKGISQCSVYCSG